MAQIIKHRRGSLEGLAAVTSSINKGEIVIASGSSNLTVSNGTSLVFAAVENGQLQPVNRFLIGTDAPPTFANSTYNGLVKGVPFYDSVSGSLYLLGSDGNDKLNLIGNILPFSQSVDSRLDAVEASLGGGGSVGARVAALEAATASLEAFTSSQETKNQTLATLTGSYDSKFSTLATYTASVDNDIANLEAFSASQETKDATLATYTASVNNDIANLEAFSASQETKDATLATYTGSIDSKWTTLENVTASILSFTSSQETKNSTLATLTGSIASEQTAQNNRLSTIESFTGSYATTGSNVFYGTQTITGSLYITNDLVVYGSSSLLNVTASVLQLGDNTIVLNTATPAIRFAGIDVIDSGSTQATGSLYWDSLRDHWISVRPSSSTEVANTAVLIYGPMNTGSIGDETLLTAGKIPVAEGEDHIADSIMSQAGGKISIAGGLDVIGEISASTINGIGNVASFSQSLDSRLDTIEASLGGGGSIGTRVAALESFSSSQETKDATLATYTGSVDTKFVEVGASTASLNTFSASANSRLNNIEAFSASQETKDSTLATYTASVNGNISNIHSFTSSVETKLSTLSTYTASVDGNISNIHSFTSSQETKNSTLATYTASVDSRLNQLSADSASQDGRLDNLEAFSSSQETKNSTLATYTSSVNTRIDQLASFTGSYATTGSNTFIGTQTISGSVNVSGSTNFNGAIAVNDSNMNLTNSSSLNLTSGSSIYVNGDGVISGSIVGIGNVTAFSQSVDSRLDTLEGTGTIQGVGTTNDVIFNKVTTTSDVIVGGDLVVQGNTVSLNTSTLTIEDKVITLASGSTNNLTADGAGFEIASTNASFKYDGINNEFSSSVAIASNITGSLNVPGFGTSKRAAFRNAAGNLDFVAAPTTAGDLVQWDGTDFVMSNVIDGGQF